MRGTLYIVFLLPLQIRRGTFCFRRAEAHHLKGDALLVIMRYYYREIRVWMVDAKVAGATKKSSVQYVQSSQIDITVEINIKRTSMKQLRKV